MSEEHLYVPVVGLSLHAFQYEEGMEDGFTSKSVGRAGKPYINTAIGKRYIFTGSDTQGADFIVIYDNGDKDLIGEEHFNKYYTKVEQEEEEL